MSSKDFYHQIPSFKDFLGLSKNSNYRQVPEDWAVIIADVAGSTKAIQAGQYKTVNMVGASTIASVVNALGDRDIPFVFGGDGSTIVIPMAHLGRVKRALQYTQKNSQDQFGLQLRIGIVPHKDLLAAGFAVRMARYQLAPSVHQAFFKGNGLSQAEKWVKGGQYALEPVTDEKLDFDPHDGLSCRWAPLKNVRGMMLSILIKMNDVKASVDLLKDILQEIDSVVNLDHQDSHPIKIEKLHIENIGKAVDLETKTIRAIPLWSRLRIFLFFLVVRALDKKWIKSKRFSMSNYKMSLQRNSDFRKFDETLRMVIDCTPEMRNQIDQLLKRHADRQEIYYGLFASETALMTCFVQGTEDSEHVHFIDGGDGGYAMAAVAMKEQMSKA